MLPINVLDRCIGAKDRSFEVNGKLMELKWKSHAHVSWIRSGGAESDSGVTSDVLEGEPDETTARKIDSPAGTYKINISKGSLYAANYAFTFKGGALTVTSLGTTAAPTFKPGGSTYSSDQSVTISDKTEGALIYYTTNGTTPSTASTRYKGPISVKTKETIKAIAVAPGYTESAVSSAAYTIN
jgi:hypothetical protein